jgi:hypothetical protein
MDIPDRLGLHRAAHVRTATTQLAVVATARPPRTAAVAVRVRNYRATALPKDDQLFIRQDGKGVLDRRSADPLPLVQFADRGKRLAWR